MPKFNWKGRARGFEATNKAAAPAFALSLRARFATRVATSLVQEMKFYGDNTNELVDEATQLAQQDPVFVAKAAGYARNVLYLRSVPIVLTRWLAAFAPSPLVADTVADVVRRPDELTELRAYYRATNDTRALPKGIKLGLARAMSRFDAYQLAKYDRAGEFRLRDVLSLVHPKPTTPEQGEMWKALLEQRLEPPVTWEVQLTKHGNKAEVWDALVRSGNLPYMAMLRNLRNMVRVGATCLPEIAERLQDPQAVSRSKQMPFRFYAAYCNLPKDAPPYVRGAVERAFALSARNLPRLGGITVIAADNSGSMRSRLSKSSTVRLRDVANTMASLAVEFCDEPVVFLFSDDAVRAEAPRDLPPLARVAYFDKLGQGGATNLWKVLDTMVRERLHADRLIVFSDMQAWDTTFSDGSQTPAQLTKLYRAMVNPDLMVHSVDMAGYGTTQFRDSKTLLYAGWNDRVLQAIALAEKGGGYRARDRRYAPRGTPSADQMEIDE